MRLSNYKGWVGCCTQDGDNRYEDTFKYKNICENILTGINKEERDKKEGLFYTSIDGRDKHKYFLTRVLF